MRTLKFRGYNKKNGKWLYGYYLRNRGVDFVCSDDFATPEKDWTDYEVDPDSVGQFTGLQDAVGQEIYEGDLLLSHENGEVFEVVYDAPRFCFKDNDFGFRFLNHPEFFGVCGNVFDDHLNGGDHEPLDR